MSELILSAVSIITGIVCAASIICSLTATPKDDELIGRLYRILEMAALNVGKAKMAPPTKPGIKVGGRSSLP